MKRPIRKPSKQVMSHSGAEAVRPFGQKVRRLDISSISSASKTIATTTRSSSESIPLDLPATQVPTPAGEKTTKQVPYSSSPNCRILSTSAKRKCLRDLTLQAFSTKASTKYHKKLEKKHLKQ